MPGIWPRMTMTVEPPVALRGRLADADLIALSHLRWDWVWQRPQHLISRLGTPGSTYFVEEPRPCRGEARRRCDVAGPVRRLWLDVPSHEPWIGFHEVATDAHVRLVE